MSVVYSVLKDVWAYFKWKEEQKLVDFAWPIQSGFQAGQEADGYSLSWVRPEQVAAKQLAGSEIVHEVHKWKRVRRQLVLKDGSVLMRKRKSG